MSSADGEIRNRLRKHYGYLVSELSPDLYLDFLSANKVITPEEEEDLRQTQKKRFSRAQLLVDLLLTKPKPHIELFVQHLRTATNKQPHIYTALYPEEKVGEHLATSQTDVESDIKELIQQGSSQWYDIGLQLGFTEHQIHESVHLIPHHSDKLRILVELRREQVGHETVVRELLNACAQVREGVKVEPHQTPVSEKSFDPELVLSAVLKHGLDQMYSIGRKLGLTASQMTAITRPIPTNEERLRALFETKAKSIGRKKAGEQLLEACGTIPYSILRKVMDELIDLQGVEALRVLTNSVIKYGSSQWYSLGIALGFNNAMIEACTYDIPVSSSKLEALIYRGLAAFGREKLTDLLLNACETIPYPIYGAVVGDTAMPSVASALDRLGPEGKALYLQACKKGKVKINHVLMDVMGEEDAGKSCLGDSIMGEPYEANKPSTKGVKFKTMVRRAAGSNAAWKEIDDKKRKGIIDRMFAKEYVSLRKEEKAARQTDTKTGKHDFKRETSTTPPIVEDQPDQLPEDQGISMRTMRFQEFKAAQDLSEEIAAVISLMEENEEEMRKCEEMIIITMMDRGGQDQYLAIHAALMADNAYNASVCLLVIDGTKPLEEVVPESIFRQPGGSVIKQKRDVATTGADLIRHWAAALDAARPYDADIPPPYPPFLGMKYVKRPPATFIIATRKDKTEGNRDMVEKQEYSVQKIVKETGFGDRVVASDETANLILFHVDNTRSGRVNLDQTVVEIRKIISQMADDFWRNLPSIPLPWAMLDKGLSMLATSRHRVIPFRDVCEMARVCDIAIEEECKAALRYLCSLGTICFYYDIPGLSDKVLPNTQWVADVLSVFVTVLEYSADKRHLWRDLENLHNKGLMSWVLAEHLMKEAEVQENDYDVILLLLLLFNVISSALPVATINDTITPGQNFFVPCMVTREYVEDEPAAYHSAICSSTSPPPLFLVPKGSSAFLKPLFYRLVSRLVSKYYSNPDLSRNQVILHIPDVDLELELIYSTKVVIATVYYPSSFDPDRRPSDEVIRQHCIDARVRLVQELTHAKRRGMDGFKFELCVHPTLIPQLKDAEYNFEELACLDYYPLDCTLVNRKSRRIQQPKQLCLWYLAKETPNPLKVDSSELQLRVQSAPFLKVEESVVRHGQNQWSSIGCALGFTEAEMQARCHDKPMPSGKLQAIIRLKAEKVGEENTTSELLEACKHIPSPIYGSVKDDLNKSLT